MAMPRELRQEPTSVVEVISTINGAAAVAQSGVRSAPPVANPNLDAAMAAIATRDLRTLTIELHRPAPENNGWVVCFSPALSVQLRCNTDAEYLGSIASATSALFYVAKYMSKDSMPLANALSIASAAAQHIETYPSVASDSGEPVRTTRHLLNRVLNSTNGVQEYVSAQMATASLLELPSFICSHAFWYLFVRPALQYLLQRQQIRYQPYSSSATSGGEEESVQLLLGDAHNNDNGYDDNDVNLEDADEEPLLAADDDPVLVDESAAQIEITINGAVVLVSQHEHYRWRGQQLAHLNFYEYAGLVAIVKKQAPKKRQAVNPGISEVEAADDNENDSQQPQLQATGAGRHQNARFPFDPRHPLAQSHEQQLRSKQLIPFLTGRAPPTFPGRYPQPSGHDTDLQRRIVVWRCKANEFAKFYITILVPWDIETGLPPITLSYAGLIEWLHQIQAPTASFVNHCRLQLLYNAVHCGTTSSSGTQCLYFLSYMLISFFCC